MLLDYWWVIGQFAMEKRWKKSFWLGKSSHYPGYVTGTCGRVQITKMGSWSSRDWSSRLAGHRAPQASSWSICTWMAITSEHDPCIKPCLDTQLPYIQLSWPSCNMCCHPLTIRSSSSLSSRRRSEKCLRVTRSRQKAKLLHRLCRASHSNIKNMWDFISKQNKWLSKCHKLWLCPSNRSSTM